MTTSTKEATPMKRKNWFKIRTLAVGLAVAAVAAPAAQAMPEGIDGVQARSLQESKYVIVSPDDRSVAIRSEHLRAQHSIPAATTNVVSPDDRALNRASTQPKASPTAVSDSGGFELGTVAISGLVLLVAAGGLTALAIHQGQKGRLANA
jgi:hypothetical protein